MLQYKKIERDIVMVKGKSILSVILTLCIIFASHVAVFSEDITEEDSSEYITELILGDANLDGRITAADARLVLQFSASLVILSDEACDACDYTCDGKITAMDARCILRLSAKLSPFGSSASIESETDSDLPLGEYVVIDVPLLCQYPDYPSGCEPVAAVMNLQYYGIDITPDAFIDSCLSIGSAPVKENDLWYSSDPDEAFLGDPRSDESWGIWAKGLAQSIQKCLDDCEGAYDVSVTYSETLDSLCEKYIDNNIPVLVWVTAYMQAPYINITSFVIGTDKTFTWISPNHCMLLVGYDDAGYYFNDPITGKLEKYDKIESNIAFEGNGTQAVIITKS